MTVTISKAAAVMSRLPSEDQDRRLQVTFAAWHEDTGVIYRTLRLSYPDWTSLGMPDTITLTVEPGDTLNVS